MMRQSELRSRSLRAFIGSRDYGQSQSFYRALGFAVHEVGPKMSYVSVDDRLGFYLQDAYVKNWINNTMLFLEVENVEQWYESLLALELPTSYPKVRFTEIRHEDWGREFFMHDPSGVLWHFGSFAKPPTAH